MPALLDKVFSRLGRVKTNGNGAGGTTAPILNIGDNRPSVSVRYGTGLGSASWTGRDYESQATSGYCRNSDVFACVSLISQTAKQVRWYDGTGAAKSLTDPALLAKAVGKDAAFELKSTAADYSYKQINPKPSLDLLTRAGGPTFIESWISYLLLSGNAYIEAVRVNNVVKMLYLDNPATVSPVINREARHADEAVQTWQVVSPYGSGRRDFIKPWSAERTDRAIVQSKLFNPVSTVIGMAPLEAAMLKIDTQNEGSTLLKRVLQRGYSPGWIEAAKDSLWEDTQVAQLRERIKYSKVAGEELFLENAQWHPMGFTPVDSGVADQQLLTKRDIASVFHVDPSLIGDVNTRTYATYAQSRLALYMEAVLPHLRLFRDTWNKTIGAELGSPLDFDKDSFDAITQARSEATDRVHKLWTSGLISQNEARADLEYDPVEGGDVFYLPANMVPMGDAEAQVPQE